MAHDALDAKSRLALAKENAPAPLPPPTITCHSTCGQVNAWLKTVTINSQKARADKYAAFFKNVDGGLLLKDITLVWLRDKITEDSHCQKIRNAIDEQRIRNRMLPMLGSGDTSDRVIKWFTANDAALAEYAETLKAVSFDAILLLSEDWLKANISNAHRNRFRDLVNIQRRAISVPPIPTPPQLSETAGAKSFPKGVLRLHSTLVAGPVHPMLNPNGILYVCRAQDIARRMFDELALALRMSVAQLVTRYPNAFVSNNGANGGGHFFFSVNGVNNHDVSAISKIYANIDDCMLARDMLDCQFLLKHIMKCANYLDSKQVDTFQVPPDIKQLAREKLQNLQKYSEDALKTELNQTCYKSEMGCLAFRLKTLRNQLFHDSRLFSQKEWSAKVTEIRRCVGLLRAQVNETVKRDKSWKLSEQITAWREAADGHFDSIDRMGDTLLARWEHMTELQSLNRIEKMALVRRFLQQFDHSRFSHDQLLLLYSCLSVEDVDLDGLRNQKAPAEPKPLRGYSLGLFTKAEHDSKMSELWSQDTVEAGNELLTRIGKFSHAIIRSHPKGYDSKQSTVPEGNVKKSRFAPGVVLGVTLADAAWLAIDCICVTLGASAGVDVDSFLSTDMPNLIRSEHNEKQSDIEKEAENKAIIGATEIHKARRFLAHHSQIVNPKAIACNSKKKETELDLTALLTHCWVVAQRAKSRNLIKDEEAMRVLNVMKDSFGSVHAGTSNMSRWEMYRKREHRITSVAIPARYYVIGMRIEEIRNALVQKNKEAFAKEKTAATEDNATEKQWVKPPLRHKPKATPPLWTNADIERFGRESKNLKTQAFDIVYLNGEDRDLFDHWIKDPAFGWQLFNWRKKVFEALNQLFAVGAQSEPTPLLIDTILSIGVRYLPLPSIAPLMQQIRKEVASAAAS